MDANNVFQAIPLNKYGMLLSTNSTSIHNYPRLYEMPPSYIVSIGPVLSTAKIPNVTIIDKYTGEHTYSETEVCTHVYYYAADKSREHGDGSKDRPFTDLVKALEYIKCIAEHMCDYIQLLIDPNYTISGNFDVPLPYNVIIGYTDGVTYFKAVGTHFRAGNAMVSQCIGPKEGDCVEIYAGKVYNCIDVFPHSCDQIINLKIDVDISKLTHPDPKHTYNFAHGNILYNCDIKSQYDGSGNFNHRIDLFHAADLCAKSKIVYKWIDSDGYTIGWGDVVYDCSIEGYVDSAVSRFTGFRINYLLKSTVKNIYMKCDTISESKTTNAALTMASAGNHDVIIRNSEIDVVSTIGLDYNTWSVLIENSSFKIHGKYIEYGGWYEIARILSLFRLVNHQAIFNNVSVDINLEGGGGYDGPVYCALFDIGYGDLRPDVMISNVQIRGNYQTCIYVEYSQEGVKCLQ